MLRAARYYDARRPGLGDEFLDEIALVVGRIRTSPKAIAPFAADMRARLLSRFPYALVYCVAADGAIIVAVAHNSRRTGYWRRRLGSQ
jgi:hypothetical protein